MKEYLQKKQPQGLLWVAPAIVLILIFSIYPALSALLHSFTEWDLVHATFIGLDNFINVFKDAIFWNSCLNLVILMVTGLIFGNLAGIILAELLHNLKSEKTSNVYRFIFILPTLVPAMVNMLVWTKIIFHPSSEGLINSIILLFGGTIKGWYFEESIALLTMVLTGFPFLTGTTFLIYLAGLNNIPESVYEAAKLDGITPLKRVFAIDLPLMKGQIKYFIMLGIIGGIQSFSMQLMFTFGGPNEATNVPGYYMYQQAFMFGKFGYAAAIGFILFVVTLIITIINNKFLKSTEEL